MTPSSAPYRFGHSIPRRLLMWSLPSDQRHDILAELEDAQSARFPDGGVRSVLWYWRQSLSFSENYEGFGPVTQVIQGEGVGELQQDPVVVGWENGYVGACQQNSRLFVVTDS